MLLTHQWLPIADKLERPNLINLLTVNPLKNLLYLLVDKSVLSHKLDNYTNQKIILKNIKHQEYHFGDRDVKLYLIWIKSKKCAFINKHSELLFTLENSIVDIDSLNTVWCFRNGFAVTAAKIRAPVLYLINPYAFDLDIEVDTFNIIIFNSGPHLRYYHHPDSIFKYECENINIYIIDKNPKTIFYQIRNLYLRSFNSTNINFFSLVLDRKIKTPYLYNVYKLFRSESFTKVTDQII